MINFPGRSSAILKISSSAVFISCGREFRSRRSNPARIASFFIEPRTDHERKSEGCLVGGVLFLEPGDFCRGQLIQTGTGLFAGGFAGERAGQGGPAYEVGMRANQIELPRFAGIFYDVAERLMQFFQAGERTLRTSRFGDPRGVFKNRPNDADKITTLQTIQGREGVFFYLQPCAFWRVILIRVFKINLQKRKAT